MGGGSSAVGETEGYGGAVANRRDDIGEQGMLGKGVDTKGGEEGVWPGY